MKNTKKEETEAKPRRKSTRNNTTSETEPPIKNSKVDELKQISEDAKKEVKHKEASAVIKPSSNDEKTSVEEKIERKNVSENLARKVITLEENEAASRNSEDDLKEFQNTCANVESRISNINDLKKSKPDNTERISENKLEAILLTTNLKRLNRLTQIRGKLAKESTQEVKKKVDGLHLDLQNLLYEVMHVKKEIQKCMNFSSKDEEIDLVSVETFYDEAPSSISQPKVTKTDAHKQMLARLDWELKRRKELASQKESLVAAKKKTEGEINQKAEYLCNLKPRLEQIIKASRPVQECMKIPLEAEALLWEKAQYLSRPLYVLYIQAKAFKDVCDKKMNVLITGDLVDAKSSFLADEIDSGESGESETETEADADEPTSSRKHKRDKERLNEQRKQLLRLHPLSVCLEITEKDIYKLKLTFNHVPALHINTVKIQLEFYKGNENLEKSLLLSPSNILRDLLSNDAGRESPNTANEYQLERLKMDSFSSYIDTIGVPYFWVQWICGVNYMPNQDLNSSIPDASLSVKHFQDVVRKIKSRMRSRLSLQKQVEALEQLIIPEPKKPSMKECFPSNITTTLSNWKMFTYEEFCTMKCSKELEDLSVVDKDCFFYQATFNREEAVNVTIVLNHDYPKQLPLMLLSTKDRASVNVHTSLKCLESELNGYTEELTTKDDENMVLSNMLTRLQGGFDMFCETEKQGKTKERLYSRKFRGRDRNRPYHFKEDGYFVHR